MSASRFKPAQSGNPSGRPRGARNKATIAAEALLDGEAEAITRKAIEAAKDGDMVAIRLCLERIVAPRKDRHVSFTLPPMDKASDAAAAAASIIGAVSNGELTPGEASTLLASVDNYTRILAVTDLETRIEQLEKDQ
ncbi:MAG: DUF5681 domain-containing protein [Methyloceanibacter sp.]